MYGRFLAKSTDGGFNFLFFGCGSLPSIKLAHTTHVDHHVTEFYRSLDARLLLLTFGGPTPETVEAVRVAFTYDA